MTKTTVWRIEDSEGNGPYRGEDNIARYLGEMQREGLIDNGPLPWSDDMLQEKFNRGAKPANWLCGFANIEQYKSWFCSEEARDLLDRQGYCLVKYEVDSADAWVGRTQAIFSPDKAKRVEVRACNAPDKKIPAAKTVHPSQRQYTL